MSAFTLVYAIVIILIVKRRELQPIKMKGWRLIVVSLMGSGFLLISEFLAKVFKSQLVENNTIKAMWPGFGIYGSGGTDTDCDYPWKTTCPNKESFESVICLV